MRCVLATSLRRQPLSPAHAGAAWRVRALAEHGLLFSDKRKFLRFEIVARRRGERFVTVGQVKHGDASLRREFGKFARARQRTRGLLLAPRVPCGCIELSVVADQARLERRIVEHGFVHIDDYRRRQFAGVAAALALGQSFPGWIGQRLEQLVLGRAIDFAVDQIMFNRRLCPRGGIQTIIRGNAGVVRSALVYAGARCDWRRSRNRRAVRR